VVMSFKSFLLRIFRYNSPEFGAINNSQLMNFIVSLKKLPVASDNTYCIWVSRCVTLEKEKNLSLRGGTTSSHVQKQSNNHDNNHTDGCYD